MTLLSKRGESIMEVMVAMVILSMLLTTVTTVIRFTLVTTGNMLSDSTAKQAEFNHILLGNYDEVDDGGMYTHKAEIKFSSDDLDNEVIIEGAVFFEKDNVVAFKP